MAAASAAITLGVDLKTIALGIENMKGVPGRMELVPNDRSLTIVVDYAHTPDALEKALGAAKQITRGRILTVFGCGGDRDRGKRDEMGRVAGQNSHIVFITSTIRALKIRLPLPVKSKRGSSPPDKRIMCLNWKGRRPSRWR